jgi:hypothetical protein
MTLIAAVILVVGATTLFTLLIRAKDIPQPDPVSPTQHLEERKARIYENLRDLQFEFRVGKLSDSDYQRTKFALQQELAGVLAEIDRVGAATEPGAARIKSKAQAAAAPAAKPKPKQGLAQSSSPVPDEGADQSLSGRVACPHCGAKFRTAMKFCGECGKAMA